MRRRSIVVLAAALPAALAATLLTAPAAFAADTDVVINEVQSNSATNQPDFIELMNKGGAPVDISNWVLRDSDDTRDLRIPEGLVLAPGEFFIVQPDGLPGGFSLGAQDSARLFAADGVTQIDSYAWTEHARSDGRVPDGTGDFVDTEPTPGVANVGRAQTSPIVINEIESNGDGRGDWVELANTDTVHTVDISGWSIVDSDPEHEPIVLPEGSLVESGGYFTIVTEPNAYNATFGLGGDDSVTLRDATGAIVERVAWTEHASGSLARCADMTGDVVDVATSTFGLVNDCATPEVPVVDAQPWPFSSEVADAVAVDTWGDDMSGLDFSADGTLYAINNDNAEIFELQAGEDGLYTIAASWVATYTDGSGQPDAEGLTVAGDGAIFLATERDNVNKGVSDPRLLRVELGEGGVLTTTHEWDASTAFGEIGVNLGPEAIEWISDADAQRLGVLDASGTAYDPDEFEEHFGGIFAVAVEQTGMVSLVVLEADGTITVLQETGLGEALDLAMGLDWHAGGSELWALCDEACENRVAVLDVIDGTLQPVDAFAAPESMHSSFTNEGLAIDWCEDAGAEPTVAWISDSAHDGVSLRVAPGATCPQPTSPGAGGTDDIGTGDDGTDDGAAGNTDGVGNGVGTGAGNGTGAGSGGGAADEGGASNANATGGRSTLPRTGGEGPLDTMLMGGLLLLLAGGALVLARRRYTA